VGYRTNFSLVKEAKSLTK